MRGLQRIAKLYGGMIVNGVKWSWDYARDAAVKAPDMPTGGERWKASERAKYAARTPTQGDGDDNA